MLKIILPSCFGQNEDRNGFLRIIASDTVNNYLQPNKYPSYRKMLDGYYPVIFGNQAEYYLYRICLRYRLFSLASPISKRAKL